MQPPRVPRRGASPPFRRSSLAFGSLLPASPQDGWRRRSRRSNGVTLTRSSSAFESADAAELGEETHPERGHGHGPDAADQDRGHRAEEGRGEAGLELSE